MKLNMKKYIILLSALMLLLSPAFAENNVDSAISIIDKLPTLKTSEEIAASFEELGRLWFEEDQAKVEDGLKSLDDHYKGTQYEPMVLYLLAKDAVSDKDKMKYIDRLLTENPRHFLADDLLFKKFVLLMKPFPQEEVMNEQGDILTLYPSPESIGDIFAVLDDLANNYQGYYFNDIGYGLMIDEQKLKDNGNGYLFYVAPQALWEKANIYSLRAKQYKESIDVLNKLEKEYPDGRITYSGQDIGSWVGIAAPEADKLKAEIYARDLHDQEAASNSYYVILTKYPTDFRYSVKGSWNYIGVLGQMNSLLDGQHKRALFEKAIKEIKNPSPRRAVYKELIKLEDDKGKKQALLEKAIQDILIDNNTAYGDFDDEYNGDAFVNELGSVMKGQKEYLLKLDDYYKAAKTDKAKGFIDYAKANVYSNTGRLSEAKKIYDKLLEDPVYRDITFDDEEAYYTPNKLGELVKVRLAYVEYLNSNYVAAKKLLASYSGPSLDSTLVRKKINAINALIEKNSKTKK